MEKRIEGNVVENIEAGEQECQIVLTGKGYAFVGQGMIQRLEPGERMKSASEDGTRKYRKVTPLMAQAAATLVKAGWRGEQLRELFGINRTAAYELAKQAREEHSRAVVEAALERRRKQEAQETIRLRDEWQRQTKSPEGAGETQRGYSLGSNVRFHS